MTRDELYTEAIRTCLAAAKARQEARVADCATLYQGYLADARRAGFDTAQAWQMLAVAGIAWTARLVAERAGELGVDLEEYYADVATETAGWAAARASG